MIDDRILWLSRNSKNKFRINGLSYNSRIFLIILDR
jgi:hypothetical protein